MIMLLLRESTFNRHATGTKCYGYGQRIAHDLKMLKKRPMSFRPWRAKHLTCVKAAGFGLQSQANSRDSGPALDLSQNTIETNYESINAKYELYGNAEGAKEEKIFFNRMTGM